MRILQQDADQLGTVAHDLEMWAKRARLPPGCVETASEERDVDAAALALRPVITSATSRWARTALSAVISKERAKRVARQCDYRAALAVWAKKNDPPHWDDT